MKATMLHLWGRGRMRLANHEDPTMKGTVCAGKAVPTARKNASFRQYRIPYHGTTERGKVGGG